MFKSISALLPAMGALMVLQAAAVRGDKTTPPPAQPIKERKYAPSREIDILHLTLDVTPDFQRRTVAGKTTLKFKPIAKPLQELRLDAVDLNVSAVEATQAVRAYEVTKDQVVVTFKSPIAAGQEVNVTLTHSAEPKRGLYFRTPEMGYKAGEAHLFTQGETTEARHWFPSFDEPNEKFTSEVICHVPAGMKAFSNGRLVSQKADAATGLTAFRWLQEQPHSNYLISLVAGPFQSIEDRYRDIPLAFHVLPSELAQAQSSFRSTKDMMGYFEQEIGVAYPWVKYDQIAPNDFMFGGMENTSITTLTDGTLFTAATENIRSSDPLVAHELAHQWFGDLLTTKDWSHIWLNEGFATYYTHLYMGHQQGHDTMLYELYADAASARSPDRKPIVYRDFDNAMEQFGYRAYPKGGWVVHMLRSQLGEDLFRRVIKTYVERNRFQNVVTQDLNAVVEELSGRSFDQFFDQWVYYGHYPQLELRYSWDEKLQLVKITVLQNQKLDEKVRLFKFPVTLRFKTAAGAKVDQQITVSKQSEDFYVPLPKAPVIVRFDPDYSVLAEVDFKLSNPMLYAQLADQDDVMGRVLAIDQLLAQNNDQADFVAALKKVLQGDKFYGVRVRAAEALRKVHTEEALEALVDSLDQDDARVRAAVVGAIGGFYRQEAFDALYKHLPREKNPIIVSAGLKAIAVYSQPQVRELLLKYLAMESYRNELADGAIAAMRVQGDPAYIAPVREAIETRSASFTSNGLGAALDTLAHLAQEQENKDEVREFIAGFTASKKNSVQRAAITALGTLGDPRAIAVLQTFAGANEEASTQKVAAKAVAQLRETRKAAAEVDALRKEVLELGKTSRKLKEELEGLNKQMEALRSRRR